MSGDVSDESAKSIGKFLGASMVITGQLIDLDGSYRYRTSAISVEEAVRASITRLNVRSDAETRRMIAALAKQQNKTKVAKYGVSEKTAPQTAGTFLDRGILFASRGDYEMAITDFTAALRIDPNSAQIYTERGIAYSDKGNYDRAIADYSQAIRLAPNYAIAYINRGITYGIKRDWNRAIADYEAALRLDPNNADYKQRLENARKSRGR